MNKKTTAILFGSALLIATGTVFAFGGPGNCEQRSGSMGSMGAMGKMGGGQFGGQMQGFSQIENLTSEQRTQLRDLRRSQRDSMRSLRDAMSDNHVAMRDAMEDGADSATIQKLAEARGATVTTMSIQHAEMKKKVDAILTEEQRNSLAAMEPSRFGKYQMGNRHKMGGHQGW